AGTSTAAPMQPEGEVLDMSLSELGISTRVETKLLESGVTDARELTRRNQSDLLALDGIGAKAVEEIEQCLAEFGLGLN
ncbi:MAG: DNA-directed RNA polymerase subunit alpha C-terminal domain-containing protein, partial [Coriobacteriia bacterium]|nr:DNA-directed RNA polymerase subunit alpha C-terminal domain-containing protein [Coriobacteriia bacterium]